MGESTNPLRVEYAAEVDGLTIVRQAPPAGAASFSATYVGPAGWGFEGPREAGTARLVNQLLTSAAGPYDRVALARRLDRAGATLSHECTPESAEVTIWGPADEWELLLGLLATVVLRPRFDPEDVARVRRQALERRLREMAQPSSRAEFEFLRAVFPEGHPYRTTGRGESASLKRLTRAELIRFHRAHYTSGEAQLVVTGPARAAPTVRVARRLFRPFAEQSGPKLRVPGASPTRHPERRVEMPGHAQVEVRVGGSSIARGAPEHPAAYLANEVLGGRPLLARLFQRVREKGGLAYHASSGIEAMRFGGYWVAQAGTGADRWRRVVPMLIREITRLQETMVSERELNSIRESAIGQIPLSLESTAEAHELAVDVAYHRLPGDYWMDWPERLRGVRPAEVRRAAELAMDRQSAVTVLAGPLSSVRGARPD